MNWKSFPFDESLRLDSAGDRLQSHVVVVEVKLLRTHSLVVIPNDPDDSDDGSIIAHDGLDCMYEHLDVILPTKGLKYYCYYYCYYYSSYYYYYYYYY